MTEATTDTLPRPEDSTPPHEQPQPTHEAEVGNLHKENSAVYAQELIDTRAVVLGNEVAKGVIDPSSSEQMNAAAFSLFSYHELREGLPDGSYKRKDTPTSEVILGRKVNNIFVTTTDGQQVAVTLLTEGKTNPDGTRVFVCDAVDPDDPTKKLTNITVTRDEMATKHLQNNAEMIAGNFDGDDALLVRWSAEGAQGEPPVDESKLAELKNPITSVDKTISDYGVSLRDQIEAIQTQFKDHEMPNEKTAEVQKMEHHLALLGLAQTCNGEAGVILKKALIKKVAESAGGMTKLQLEVAARKLDSQAEISKIAMGELLIENGLTEEQIASFDENPESIFTYLNEKSTMSSEKQSQIAQALFGENFDINQASQLDTLMDKIIDTADMDPEKRDKLKNVLKGTGKGIGWILLALLAASGSIVVGSVIAATKNNR